MAKIGLTSGWISSRGISSGLKLEAERVILIGEAVELVGVPLTLDSAKEEPNVVEVAELRFDTINGGLSLGLMSK